MDRRLLALSAVVAAAAVAPGNPAVVTVLMLALPVAGLAGAAVSGAWGAAWMLAPGAGVLLARGPEGLPAYVAAGLGGLVTGALLRRGAAPGRAIAWGIMPAAAWTASLAWSGFDPVPPEIAATFRRLATEQASGAPALAADPDLAISLVRRTWVGAEVLFAAALLALAYRLVTRLFPERLWPVSAPFERFDLPDWLVGGLLAGLVAVLAAQRGAPDAFASLGGNLLMGIGALYAVRGVAILAFWLVRTGLGRRAVTALLLAGAVVFLPVFPLLAAGLGLFDTWFDFRRVKGPERGNHPLSFRHSSSDDGT